MSFRVGVFCREPACYSFSPNAHSRTRLMDIHAALAGQPDYVEVERAEPAKLEELLQQSVTSPPSDLPAFLHAWLRRLTQVASTFETDRLILLLIDAACTYYLDGRDVAGALDPISRAIRFSEERGREALLRRALSIQGLIFAANRKTPEALVSLTRAMDIADRLEDRAGLAAAWINVGVSLFEASLYAEARICYERGQLLTNAVSDRCIRRRTRALAMHGVALSSLWLGDYRTGVAASEEASRQIREPSTREEEQALSVIESVYSQLLLALGRAREAEVHAAASVELAERCGSKRARVQAAMTSALLAVHKGRTDDGLALIESIMGEAKALPGTHLELLRISIEVYERAGRPDSALKRLHELMILNKQGAAALLSVSDTRLPNVIGVPDGGVATCLITAKRAAELQGALTDQLTNILNAAITTALRGGHDHYRVFRIGKLARCFSLALGWSRDRTELLALAVRLCDLGMIVVPDALLQKQHGLSPSERKLVEEHTRVGPELLAQAQLAVLQPCLVVARFHHERWDGSGPWSISGEAIPVEARIASLCDVLDSLTHRRPWRPAMSLSAALREIERQIGTRFDPMLARPFLAFIRETFWSVDDFELFLRAEAVDNAYVRTREQIASMVERGPQL